MRWVLLFGGIALLSGAGYVVLGWWLWRRGKALFVEVSEATDRIELALADAPASASVGAAAADPAGWDTALPKGVPSKD